MSEIFTVQMYNVSNVSLKQYPDRGPHAKQEKFDNKTKALEFAYNNKDQNVVVIVKNKNGDVIIKYDNGIEV